MPLVVRPGCPSPCSWKIPVLACVALLTTGPALAQVTRVSVATDGTQANGPSYSGMLSGSGRFVVFSSEASNLVPDDTNGVRDIFVRDLLAQTTTRVSVTTDGTQGAGLSVLPDISDDGSIVAFVSEGKLADGDGTPCTPAQRPCGDIYVHDRTTGETTLVSVASDGTQANRGSNRPRLTGDGRYVLFQSDATNLVADDTNGIVDAFLHDRVTHTTIRVSLGPQGQQRPGILEHADRNALDMHATISRDGRSVAFAAAVDEFGGGSDGGTCSFLPYCSRAYVRTLDSGEVRRLPSSVQETPVFETFTRASQIMLSRDGRYAGVGLDYQFGPYTAGVSELHDVQIGVILSSSAAGGLRLQTSGGTIALSPDGHYLADGMPSSAFHNLEILDRVTGDRETLPPINTNPLVAAYPGGFDTTSRWMTFMSIDPSFVSGDTNGLQDVFLLDRDGDQDGMSTLWEMQFGLDPANAADALADPDGDGVANLEEFQRHSNPIATHTRYFAEGAANSFFSTEIAVLNPDTAAANVTVRLLGANGMETVTTRIVGGRRRATFWPGQVGMRQPDTTFSITVESDQPIVADRLMTWDRQGYGSHLETSIEAPETTWYLAEGATGGPFALYYLLQNPGVAEAAVTVNYLRPSPLPPIVKAYTVAPRSRFTIDVTGEDPGLAAAEVSAKITSTQPIVVERAMYRSRPDQFLGAGHDGAGITAPATRWFLAEGATGFFDEYVLIANAEAATARITATFLLEDGAPFSDSFDVAGYSRYTLDLKRYPQLASTPVSVIVASTNAVPVVVERVMWWPAGTDNWYEASLSAGVTGTGTRWAMAEGKQARLSGLTQTYVLIANTDPDHDGTAAVTLLDEDGGTGELTVPLPRNSRTTVDVSAMADVGFMGDLFGIIVESDGVPIVVERSLYSTIDGVQWAAGATAVATNITPSTPTP